MMKSSTTNSFLTGTKAVGLVVIVWALAFPSMLWALRQILQ